MKKNTNLNPKVCHVQYAPISDTEKISVINNECLVVFKTGKTWIDFYATPGGVEFEFPQDTIYKNVMYKQKVMLMFPGMDTANVNDLFNAGDEKYVVKVTINSADNYIVGSHENPAQYIDSFGTGKGGRSITFWCDAENVPFPYRT